MDLDNSRFVYLYSSSRGDYEVPVYVGRGTATRVDGHGPDDPNPELAAVIASGKYTVEVLDCGDDRTAMVVEGALISAMRGRSRVNLTNGRLDHYNFAPLGVPVELAPRRAERALSPSEIVSHVGGRVLFVRIGPGNLNDPGRGLIDPGNPSDAAVADRLTQWWYLSSGWIESWITRPSAAPKALVGIAGTKHRYVVGSIGLSDVDWTAVRYSGKAVSLLADEENVDIDAFNLRGRTVKDGAIFGRASWEHVRLYGEDGVIARPRT